MTTRQEAEDIIGQIATSQLEFPQDIAFAGKDYKYWRACNLYRSLGLAEKQPYKAIITILARQAMAGSLMCHASTLERVSATLPPQVIEVERPTMPEDESEIG